MKESAALQAYRTWLKEKVGGITLGQGVDILESTDAEGNIDRKLVATKAISPGQLLVQCPSEWIISPNSARDGFAAVLVWHRAQLDSVPSHVILAAWVAYLKDYAATTPSLVSWVPYVNCLPTMDAMAACPATWPASIDKAYYVPMTSWHRYLEGTNLFSAGQERRRAQEALYAETLPDTIKALVSLERYMWGHVMLTSRGFPYRLLASQLDSKSYAEDDECLVPLVEFMNHKPLTPITWRVTARHFAFEAEQQINVGEEIYNNYRPKGNEELLMGYGFALPDNPCEYIAVKAPGAKKPWYLRDPDRAPPSLWRDTGIPEEMIHHFRQEHAASSTGVTLSVGMELHALLIAYSCLSSFDCKIDVGYDRCEHAREESPTEWKPSIAKWADIYRESQWDIVQRILYRLSKLIFAFFTFLEKTASNNVSRDFLQAYQDGTFYLKWTAKAPNLETMQKGVKALIELDGINDAVRNYIQRCDASGRADMSHSKSHPEFTHFVAMVAFLMLKEKHYALPPVERKQDALIYVQTRKEVEKELASHFTEVHLREPATAERFDRAFHFAYYNSVMYKLACGMHINYEQLHRIEEIPDEDRDLVIYVQGAPLLALGRSGAKVKTKGDKKEKK